MSRWAEEGLRVKAAISLFFLASLNVPVLIANSHLVCAGWSVHPRLLLSLKSSPGTSRSLFPAAASIGGSGDRGALPEGPVVDAVRRPAGLLPSLQGCAESAGT